MSASFVLDERKPKLPPPRSMTGPVAWVRQNLFSSVGNSVLTLAGLYLCYLAVPSFLDWALFSATWEGADRSACLGEGKGACWPFVEAKLGQFVYGRYPVMELWRPNVVFGLGVLGLIPLLVPKAPYKSWNLGYLLIFYPIVSVILLRGGLFGLAPVETSDWGGLLVTLIVAASGITASLPLGVLLALGRRSAMPVIRLLSVMFIEFWRGVPLVTVLFMASVMLPLFLPEGADLDKLLRALIGVALFASAYMAEVVRGGLQALPKGQEEEATALGLSYTDRMWFVLLPQALRHVIPGIVNTFIGLFKDTTLVLIIGLFDLLGIIQSHFTDSSWATPQTAATGYVFAAFVFWVFCFGMSRYSVYMERYLGRGYER